DDKNPKHLPLPTEPDARVHEREADAVQRVQNLGAQERNFSELEQGRPKGTKRRVKRLRIIELADRVYVQNQIAKQRDSRDTLDPERDVAGVAPPVFAQRQQQCLGHGAFGFSWNLPETSNDRFIFMIESAGLMPFGQAATQLNWVWQRQTPSSAFKAARRSSTSPSRGSSRRSIARLMPA